MRTTLVTALLPLALFVCAAPAIASEAYPQHLAAKYALECVPGCQICHLDAGGGPQKINRQFGFNLKLAGLGIQDVAGLDAALAKYNATLDSDSDGATDLVELAAGTDPNGPGTDWCTGPKYGCGAATITRAASKRGVDPAATLAGSLLFVAGLLVMRRRRR